MTIKNLNLFNAIYANMDYLSQRQKVIASNIANADTPGFKAQELRGAPDFQRILGENMSTTKTIGMKASSANHLDVSGHKVGAERENFRGRASDSYYEISPSGNSVVIEEQMIKANEVISEHRMMANLHEKYLNMMRAATGQNR